VTQFFTWNVKKQQGFPSTVHKDFFPRAHSWSHRPRTLYYCYNVLPGL